MSRIVTWLALIPALGCGSVAGRPDAAPADAAVPDAPVVVDAAVPDAGCAPVPGSPHLRPETIQIVDHPDEVRVALPADYEWQPVAIPIPGPTEGAAVGEDPSGNVLVFWASRASSGATVQDEVAAVDAAVTASLIGTADGQAQVISPGTEVMTHDGYPAVIDREVRIYMIAVRTLTMNRLLFLAALLGREWATLGLPLPPASYLESTVIRYSVIRRGDDRTIVMAALVDRVAYDDRWSPVRSVVRALAGGSLVTTPAFVPVERCTTATSTAIEDVDLITVDPGYEDCDDLPFDCYNDKKAAFYARLFDRLAASGLDARVATGSPPVNPMNDYHPDQPLCPGDAFLDAVPSNRQLFLDCAAADLAGGGMLQQAQWSVERVLPRADAADRLRPEAQAVVVLVAPWYIGQELFAPSFNFPPRAWEQAPLDAWYLSREAFFHDHRVILHAYVHLGEPAPPCPNLAGFGYPDIAFDLGGSVFDVCYGDSAASAESVVDDTIASASPFLLTDRPIATSLVVAAESRRLTPSLTDGFEYRGAYESSIVVRGISRTPSAPTTIGLDYLVWEQ